MKCPCLINLDLPTCKAGTKSYIPTLFEFDEYCTNDAHKKCPFYRGLIYADRLKSEENEDYAVSLEGR